MKTAGKQPKAVKEIIRLILIRPEKRTDLESDRLVQFFKQIFIKKEIIKVNDSTQMEITIQEIIKVLGV
jgi:hypothetical protein